MTAIELVPGEKLGRLKLGRLKLLSRHIPPRMPWEDSDNPEDVTWLAECDCGETTVVEEEKLQYASYHECGICRKKREKKMRVGRMPKNEKKEDEKKEVVNTESNVITRGAKFGKLEIICDAFDSTPEYPKWKTRCECGNETVFSQRQLIESRRPIRSCVDCLIKLKGDK